MVSVEIQLINHVVFTVDVDIYEQVSDSLKWDIDDELNNRIDGLANIMGFIRDDLSLLDY